MNFLRPLIFVAIDLVPTLAHADADIRLFTIDVAEDEVVDLDDRFSQIRWPQQLPGTSWEHMDGQARA